jgi:hypothetical protein
MQCDEHLDVVVRVDLRHRHGVRRARLLRLVHRYEHLDVVLRIDLRQRHAVRHGRLLRLVHRDEHQHVLVPFDLRHIDDAVHELRRDRDTA